ncbi:MAG TPA: LytR C-terminal domain-containing protein [Mycobacteriales bacterium]|nr:LytR C-terminal domain-containing protein [Mycobacteriales bacterium]
MARLRSALAAPGTTRLAGIVVVLVGVALLIVGVLALGGGSPDSGAAPAPVSPSVGSPSVGSPSVGSPSVGSPGEPTGGSGVGSAPPPTSAPSSAPSSAPPRTTVAPLPPRTATPRAPLTVLNNSVIRGLADRAATAVQSRGWQVAQVGNFAGQLPATTVYYTPGNAGEEAAARELAREFPQVGQVLPRYAGLPPTPAGIVLVVTRDWS